MSFAMDENDLLGFIRGACLVAVVRQVSRSPQREDVDVALSGNIGESVRAFAPLLSGYTSVDCGSIEAAPRELLAEGSSDFYEIENINMQLGLLSRKPIPVYPFVSKTRVDSVVLMRPFLDVSKNLLHAAVRLRIEAASSTPQGDFWNHAEAFIRRCWGGDPPSGLFRCVGIDVASDIVFHNHDIADRSDREQAARAAAVFNELRQAWDDGLGFL